MLKAVEGRAVVTINATADTTDTGIFLPYTVREPSTEATVVASAIDGVNPGDTVLLLSGFAGAEFKIEGVKYVSVLEEEILGVLG